jgi:hypothetical protein
MRMRKTVVPLLLLLGSSPAFAQAAPPPPAFELPPELTDPATAQKLAVAMQAASRALFRVKVGEMRAALEGREATPQERNETVGDMVRRQNPNFDRDFERQIATAGPKIQHSLKALNQALPEVMRGLADAQQALDRAVANLPDPNYPRR